jgi:hypothetical protein
MVVAAGQMADRMARSPGFCGEHLILPLILAASWAFRRF